MRDCEAKGNMTNRGHYTKRQKSGTLTAGLPHIKPGNKEHTNVSYSL